MTRLMTAAALCLLLAAPALAQTTTPPKTEAAPVVTKPMSPPVGMFYSERGEWRASKLMGTKVTNAGGDTIGDINEILIDKSGRIAAVVIGVGGFLGMGERHAAVAFSALQVTRDKDDNPLIKVNITKEQLKSAPEWAWRAASLN
ncbi:MAG: PRC-barrel domain-containing protein [Hyphomicrobiaceae bacterium]|nr:PRC-barrel domain-containing protein [Hyphomicrobiaceae bacterium]